MGSTAAVTETVLLLRHLAAGSRGTLRAAPAAAAPPPTSIEDTMRALAILAQLRDGSANADRDTSSSLAIDDPLASKTLLKLPGLFGDIKLSPSTPRL
jgi:hypothetical protein